MPLGVDKESEEAQKRVDPKRLMPYVDFCSQLITNHWNSPPSESVLKPKSILSVDIKQDPEGFIKKMCAVVTHLVLESTSMKNQRFLAAFNPSAQQNDIVLRDIVYTTMTTREVVKRILCAENLEQGGTVLKELGKSLMSNLSQELFNENVFRKNYPKLVVRVLFICAVCTDNPEVLQQLKQAVIAGMYSTFKAQLLLADIFRKNFG